MLGGVVGFRGGLAGAIGIDGDEGVQRLLFFRAGERILDDLDSAGFSRGSAIGEVGRVGAVSDLRAKNDGQDGSRAGDRFEHGVLRFL